MQELLIELSVGETIQIGAFSVTVLEVDGDDLVVEIESDGTPGSLVDLEALRDALQLV
ncbi:MAG: hypothetical protein KDA80_16770 [Planctomycetaceae bacterium]|nr:hypothetical protein [Planctomycetaceae bacterium]